MQDRIQQLILLSLAILIFTANSNSISLLSLDDCFYARKGIESGRSGRFFTVTWNYHPTFQNPPLQSWILGKSFSWFGENDFAARLPSILMATGILIFVLRIGTILSTPGAATAAAYLLLLSPHFVSNARRCMLEIPLAFWITAYFWILLEGIKRPQLHVLLSAPLAAGILTKSVLGLLPVIVTLASAIVVAQLQTLFKKPWMWIGILIGMAAGASWSIDQWSRFGPEALNEHFVSEILSRSTVVKSWLLLVFGYPLLLLSVFQPVILPALAGGYSWLRKKMVHPLFIIVILWFAIPPILYSFSAARSSRYIFPVFPALALSGGWWLENSFPNISSLLRKWIAPFILMVVAACYWFAPALITRDENRELKQKSQVIQSAIPETEKIQYIGNHYWSIANPLLYYADRQLVPVDQMESFRGPVIYDRERFSKLDQSYQILLETDEWILITASGK